MSKVRVLIVDDSVVVRRLVSDVLSADPSIEVVGTAANGKIALQKIAQTTIDLITLDVEMPEMDGLQTVREIRKLHPHLPVIMFSTLTSRGAAAALDALAGGANDYVTKPANVGSVAQAMIKIRDELLPKIKVLCPQARTRIPSPTRTSFPVSCKPTARVELVVVAVSTGGPNALAAVISELPADLPVPIMIVQHMPAVFTKVLADRLNQKAAITVKEAEQGEVLAAGTVYVAAGDFHMTIQKALNRRRIFLHQETPENSCRPAADVLFRSAAAAEGPGVLGVVLTGMGQDGLRGAQSIVESGGHVIAQNEATSVVWGMPGFVARAGLAEQLLPLNEVASAITTRVMRQRTIAA